MTLPEALPLVFTADTMNYDCPNKHCTDGYVDKEYSSPDGREGWVDQVPCQVCLGDTVKASPEQILVEGADPEDACGFVRTDGEAGGFFWCVCADECKCGHCRERVKDDLD